MRVRELELMSSLLCSFEIVYYHTGRNSDGIAGLSIFRKDYQGRKRRWLENLLNEIIFRSPVEHDHNSAVRNIAKDKGACLEGWRVCCSIGLPKAPNGNPVMIFRHY
jgi:hypothetical protein